MAHEFKTQNYIVRLRGNELPGIWTVEEKKGNFIIGEIEKRDNEFIFDAFSNVFTRKELLEIAKSIQRIENIEANK